MNQLQAAKKGDNSILWTAIFCALAIGFSLAFGRDRFTLSIGLLSALLPLLVAWNAAKEKNLISPYALFAAAYAAYNGALLMRLACLDSNDFPYPITITDETALKAGLLSALGALSIAFVWLTRHDGKPLRPVCASGFETRAMLRVGWLFFLLALIFCWLQLRQLGGYLTVLGIERVERYQLMRDTSSFPYIPIESVSIGLLLLASAGRRGARFAAWTSLAAWILLAGLQGDRAAILHWLLTAACVVGTGRPELFRIRKRTVAGMAAVVLILLAVEEIRPIIPDVVRGTIGPAQFMSLVSMSDPLSTIDPARNELGGPYLSVMDAASSHQELLLGYSYLNTLPTFLPRFLYPGTKPTDLANTLAESVSGNSLFVMGWGYNPVAEAYRNFGAVGVPIVMAGWGALFLWLSRIQDRSPWALMLAATLTPEALFMNRIDFRTVYIESVIQVVILYFAYRLAKRPAMNSCELHQVTQGESH